MPLQTAASYFWEIELAKEPFTATTSVQIAFTTTPFGGCFVAGVQTFTRFVHHE
ncbi:MAG TPA: hypothetical protein VFF07_06325 [Actinomycetota bacterium]|nr:hypothetical protein [Actinomycetota bacterium]